MPNRPPAETARELEALQLHDLRERRQTANKRAILLWLVIGLVLVLFLKGVIG